MFQLAPQDPGKQDKPGDFNRGAEGAETETPKASRKVGNGEGVSPSPSDYGVWGSVVSFPDENDFSAFKASQNASGCTA